MRDPLAVPSHSHAVLLGASEYGVAHRQPTRTQVLGAGFDGLKIDNCGDDDGSGCAARLARAASGQSRHSYDARVFAQWGACSFVSRVKHLNESGRAILIENSNQAHASAAATAPSINSAALHGWPDRRVRSANSSVASRVPGWFWWHTAGSRRRAATWQAEQHCRSRYGPMPMPRCIRRAGYNVGYRHCSPSVSCGAWLEDANMGSTYA